MRSTETLRIELLGQPVRVSTIAPGLVETEFSIVRFDGDEGKAAKVYEGLQPLSATDVADAIAYAVTRPPHVDVDFFSIKPTAQATATLTHRDRPDATRPALRVDRGACRRQRPGARGP